MPQVAGKEVGPIGFGLMGLTGHPTGVIPEPQALATMRAAGETGCTLWNGGEFYGTDEANSMTIMRRYFASTLRTQTRSSCASRAGWTARPGARSRMGARRRFGGRWITSSHSWGGGTKKVDLFECARRDPDTPLEETFGVLNEYVERGELGGISLSEVSAATIHEAAKITKVKAVEIELSLWSRDPMENGIAEACAQHGIPLMAYSPLGMGVSLLPIPIISRSSAEISRCSFKSSEDIPQADHRRLFPRFQPENFHASLELVEQVKELAAKKGCTPAQLALGWCVALSRRPRMPVIVPIPGATTEMRVRENAAAVELSDGDMAEIQETLDKFKVAGGRWSAGLPVNT